MGTDAPKTYIVSKTALKSVGNLAFQGGQKATLHILIHHRYMVDYNKVTRNSQVISENSEGVCVTIGFITAALD